MALNKNKSEKKKFGASLQTPLRELTAPVGGLFSGQYCPNCEAAK